MKVRIRQSNSAIGDGHEKHIRLMNERRRCFAYFWDGCSTFDDW